MGALAIRARAYLYLEKNKEAADCKEIIASSPYKLYTRDEYIGAWDKEGTNEAIFEILVTPNYNAQRNSIGYFTHASGYGECAATESFTWKSWLSIREISVRNYSQKRPIMAMTGPIRKSIRDVTGKSM